MNWEGISGWAPVSYTHLVEIVRDVDERMIAGESQNSILESLKPVPGAWRSRRGLTLALKNEAYVQAKVRTVAVQRRLLEILATRRQAYGEDRNTKSQRVHQMCIRDRYTLTSL